jgi:Flp pilus assembly protein TadD
VCLFLVVAVLAVFGQTIHFEFLGFDDPVYVYQNARVTQPWNWPDVAWTFTHPQCSLYHPLTMISLMLDYQFHGLEAGGYHMTNVAIHAATSVLLFLVFWQMTGARWRCALLAALFAIHPLRAESVAWISERKDVLAGFFFVLMLGAYVRYVRQPGSPWRYALVLVLFGLALLSKPTVVLAPLGLVLLDFWPLQRWKPQGQPAPGDGATAVGMPGCLLWEKIPFVILSIGGGAVTLLTAHQAVGSVADVSWPVRMGNAAVSYVIYLRQTLWPMDLAAFYPYPEQGRPPGQVIAALVVLTAITAAALASWRRRPWLLAGWVWYLVMLAPMIGLVQEGAFAHADRNTYLPQIGLNIMLTWAAAEGAERWFRHRLVPAGVAAAMLVILGMRANGQVSYWRNGETLWDHTLSCTSENSFAEYSLGIYFFTKGDMEKAIFHYEEALRIKPKFVLARSNLAAALQQAGKTEDAIAQFRQALETAPDDPDIHVNLGDALGRSGRAREAMGEYRQALKISPDDENARFNLGLALFQNNDTAEAIEQFQEALKTKPDDEMVHNVLGQALAKKGRTNEAIASYQRAVEINPQFAEAYDNLGVILAQQGKIREAIASWQKALEIKPDLLGALNNLAWTLATTSDATFRNGAKAVAMAERARQLTGGENPVVLHTLAAAYAEAGRFGESVATARRALALTTEQKMDALVGPLHKEIESYRTNSPLRVAP